MALRPILTTRTRNQLRLLARRAHTMTVTLRRNGVAQDAQQGYLDAGDRTPAHRVGAAAAATVSAIKLYMAHDADVAAGDKLTFEDVVYTVRYVHPDNDVETICELEVSQ